jgi:hypothetical protein
MHACSSFKKSSICFHIILGKGLDYSVKDQSEINKEKAQSRANKRRLFGCSYVWCQEANKNRSSGELHMQSFVLPKEQLS